MFCFITTKSKQNDVIKILRRFYHQYKPKERTILPIETPLAEHFASRDVLLFRYEDPYKILRRNCIAGGMLPLWSYLAYTAWSLKSIFQPYRDQLESSDRAWVILYTSC
jgi:hypothetical protein